MPMTEAELLSAAATVLGAQKAAAKLMGTKAGRAKSPKKAESSRENGKLGGRPRRKKVEA